MAVATVDGVAQTVEGYDLTSNGIKEFLGPEAPIYTDTAAWGHFWKRF